MYRSQHSSVAVDGSSREQQAWPRSATRAVGGLQVPLPMLVSVRNLGSCCAFVFMLDPASTPLVTPPFTLSIPHLTLLFVIFSHSLTGMRV